MSTMSVSPFTDLNVSLSRAVAEALLSIDFAAFGKLSVAARGNVVFLSGMVVGEANHRSALELAQATVGVAQVIDRIHVRPAVSRPSALEVPLSTSLARDPWWQRLAVPAFLVGVVAVLVVQSWQSLIGAVTGRETPLVPVTGSVYVDGVPAAGATLHFHPLDFADASVGRLKATTDDAGRFTVSTADGVDGAPAGRYVVSLQYRPTVVRGEAYVPGDDVIPTQFADARTSPLIAEVSSTAESVDLPAFLITTTTHGTNVRP